MVLFDYIGNYVVVRYGNRQQSSGKEQSVGGDRPHRQQTAPSLPQTTLSHPILCLHPYSPHHLEPSSPTHNHYDEEVLRLAERVTVLEQRIFALTHLEDAGKESRPSCHKKKQRRKFKDLVRDQQVLARPLSAPSARRPTAQRPPSSTTSNSNTPNTTKIIPNRTDFY